MFQGGGAMFQGGGGEHFLFSFWGVDIVFMSPVFCGTDFIIQLDQGFFYCYYFFFRQTREQQN